MIKTPLVGLGVVGMNKATLASSLNCISRVTKPITQQPRRGYSTKTTRLNFCSAEEKLKASTVCFTAA